jgi:hypothetical protein
MTDKNQSPLKRLLKSKHGDIEGIEAHDTHVIQLCPCVAYIKVEVQTIVQIDLSGMLFVRKDSSQTLSHWFQ